MAKDLLKLENVYFAFTSIAEPTYKYESKIEKEFKTTIVLSKDQAKDFKRLKLNKTVKELDTKEFEAKYKFAPPFPDQDEQYFIQVSKRATYKDGNPTPEFTHPKAYFTKNGVIVEDSKVLIGNGSLANVSLETSVSTKSTQLNVSLYSVLVKNLIPYNKPKAGDEWAEEGTVSSSASASGSTEVVDDNDDLPF